MTAHKNTKLLLNIGLILCFLSGLILEVNYVVSGYGRAWSTNPPKDGFYDYFVFTTYLLMMIVPILYLFYSKLHPRFGKKRLHIPSLQ